MSYSKQTWVDDVTVVDAAALNHMEDGIDNANKGAHPGFDYTVYRTGDTYVALNRDGTVAHSEADVVSPVSSGLKGVLDTIAANNKSIFFRAGTYKFPEDPDGVEDHWIGYEINFLTMEGEGYGETIISNWRDASQGGYDITIDAEPFSFTRCHNLVMRNFRIWHGGNRDENDSCDATDFDGCRDVLVENLIIERSRARAIIADGGDQGGVAEGGVIRGCKVQGIPWKPTIAEGAAGSMTAQEYRYVVTYVDSVFGETPPSEISAWVSTNTNRLVVQIPTGPSYDATRGVTQRKIYRWSAAQTTYRLLTTVNDNTTTTYSDNATDASIASAAQPPVTSGLCLIPMEGIKLLGTNRCRVESNDIVGTSGHGIQIGYKVVGSTTRPANQNMVVNNNIRRAGSGAFTGSRAGVSLTAGDGNIVSGNVISNVGTTSLRGRGISVFGSSTSPPIRHNVIGPNVVHDDQDANTPAGGSTTSWGVEVAGTVVPDNTVLVPSSFRGMFAGDVTNSGTNTKQYTPA